LKKLLTIFLLPTFGICCGQTNLVPNPSFESFSTCPFSYDFIFFAHPWFQPCNVNGSTLNSSSSDLFSACSTSNWADTPQNFQGYQVPRTDSSYAGIILYNPLASNYREYIEVELDSALTSNKIYCLEFYVSSANQAQYTVSKIGAYFSNDSLIDTTAHNAITYVVPQIENSSAIITDTTNWVKVSGQFTATGGEKFMTIGNFQNDANTNYIFRPGGSSTAYYYIDDVSLVDCTNAGVNENTGRESISIYPNPVTDKLNIQITNYELAEIILYDLSSRKLLQQTFTNTTTINTEQLAKGMYLYIVRNRNGIIKNGKVIKQ